jgi:glycosyltransferase involved in cell wall biosynthesis
VTRVVLLEPYLTGSHREWALGYCAHSRLDVTRLALPGRFWKWRMHGAAVTLAREVEHQSDSQRPDVVLATDMLDVAACVGLARRALTGVPLVVYFHENQLAYPSAASQLDWSASRTRRAARRDMHYPFVNLTSALAADVVLWNSAYNRDSFLAALPAFLGAFPDYREADAADRVAKRSQILPPGLDVAGLLSARPEARAPGPPRVVWNHRWEHDKGPEVFFAALDVLAARGLAFEVVVLGESFVKEPADFEAARSRLGSRVRQWGHVPERSDYAAWLWQSDVVVSTARHEFFGLAVAEAIACGCRPVLPNDLAYPELIPAPWHDAVLYDDFEGLVQRLEAALTTPDDALMEGLGVAVAAFDWRTLAPRYDALLVDLARRGAATDML